MRRFVRGLQIYPTKSGKLRTIMDNGCVGKIESLKVREFIFFLLSWLPFIGKGQSVV